MSDMQIAETTERWREGLKRAASRAREIGVAQGKPDMWNKIADSLDGIRSKGDAMIAGKALTRAQVLAAIDERQRTIKVH
jgi:hypothetical protein